MIYLYIYLLIHALSIPVGIYFIARHEAGQAGDNTGWALWGPILLLLFIVATTWIYISELGTKHGLAARKKVL